MLIALALIITPALVAWLAMTLTARQNPPASSVNPRTLASLTEARLAPYTSALEKMDRGDEIVAREGDDLDEWGFIGDGADLLPYEPGVLRDAGSWPHYVRGAAEITTSADVPTPAENA